jgi:hypothetical protein
MVFVEGVLDSAGAELCKKMNLLRKRMRRGRVYLPGVTMSPPRRLGLSLDRPASADVVLPATHN